MSKGMHKSKSLKTRQESYKNQKLNPSEGYRMPGSNKK